MKKHTPKTAVVTTCENDYERYFATQPKTIQDSLVKISVLSDIKEDEYYKVVFLIKSDNVPDFIIKKIKAKSLFVENFINKSFYP